MALSNRLNGIRCIRRVRVIRGLCVHLLPDEPSVRAGVGHAGLGLRLVDGVGQGGEASCASATCSSSVPSRSSCASPDLRGELLVHGLRVRLGRGPRPSCTMDARIGVTARAARQHHNGGDHAGDGDVPPAMASTVPDRTGHHPSFRPLQTRCRPRRSGFRVRRRPLFREAALSFISARRASSVPSALCSVVSLYSSMVESFFWVCFGKASHIGWQLILLAIIVA